MSLLINGANMPEVGSYKVIVFDDPITKSRKLVIKNSYTDAEGRIVKDYPMFDFKEIPTPHGRLIDADAYIDKHEECGWLDDITVDEFNAITPTIIEAEVSE